jgi:outer membrane receptor protein involved in Fe transport
LLIYGNPNLNPEVDISYEIGLRSQITNNDALTVSAFWKDKYDFITSAVVLVKDFQGRDVNRTIRINSDYARSRGLELGYIKRIGTWYNGQLAFTYTVNTGQSASANEKLKDILASGNVEDTKEYYMPWDMPYDFKTNHVFKIDRKRGLFGKSWLNKMSFILKPLTRSGVRYTPYIFDRNDAQTGRPIYVVNPSPDARWSKVGECWFWADLTITKWWQTKYAKFSFNMQITNVFDNLNAAIINPVTG